MEVVERTVEEVAQSPRSVFRPIVPVNAMTDLAASDRLPFLLPCRHSVVLIDWRNMKLRYEHTVLYQVNSS